MKEDKQPILSICIPTYNRGNIISDCLNSIVSQLTSKDISDKVEIIVSDNCSSDNTKKIINKYIENNNIKYYKNDTNIGSNKNIIKVIGYASGKYTWLLGDDDCLTKFSLSYLLEIIEKEEFDVMFAKSISSENMNMIVDNQKNSYFVGLDITDFLQYIKETFQGYKNMISFFSFMSIIIGKTDYFRDGLENYSVEIKGNDFPQDILIYHNLKNKKIIIPDNIFVIGRLLNEGYVGSKKLIMSFKECMNFIENTNDLNHNANRQFVKKTCVKGRTKNITLGWIIAKLHINYKTNGFLKKIYYLYKRWMQ